MWKYLPFLQFLNDLVKIEIVDDIIIINNDINQTPNTDLLNNLKINHINFCNNIFVNPAWNYGVNVAKNKNICILNDDIIFDSRIFYRVESYLSDISGAIGIDVMSTPITGEIEIVPTDSERPYGFGSLMFIHKDTWVNIPESLQVYYGDDWIFNTASIDLRQNYLIKNLFHYSPHQVTSGHFYHHLEKETPYYHHFINNYKDSKILTT